MRTLLKGKHKMGDGKTYTIFHGFWWKMLIPILVLIFVLSKSETPIKSNRQQTNAVFNIIESSNFKKLIECSDVSSGVACFNRYGFVLAREVERVTGTYLDIKTINR